MTEAILHGLAAWLFVAGILGVLIRQSPLSVFMSVELMLNAANLVLVLGLGRAGVNAAMAIDGLIGVFFVIAVAAAEVAVGLAVMVLVFQRERDVDLDRASSLKG